jgi:dephospho-CoA kinase
MLRVALTGGIATGKSYVLDQFRRRGVPCLDADELARGVTVAGAEATRAIAERFGPGVMGRDGGLDRERLAALVFADEQARRDLEAIVHPAVYRAITAGLRALELSGAAVAVVDVPLLYETGHESDFDCVIVTTCPIGVQIERLVRRGLTDAEARQRLSAQWPTEKKAARADVVIRTDESFEETDRQIEEALRALKRESC